MISEHHAEELWKNLRTARDSFNAVLALNAYGKTDEELKQMSAVTRDALDECYKAERALRDAGIDPYPMPTSAYDGNAMTVFRRGG